MLDAAEACTTWGTGDEPGHLRIISTHCGPDTLFRRLVEAARRGENDFHLHTVSLYDAVRDGLAVLVPGSHQSHLDGTPRGRAKCDEAFIAMKRRRSRSEAAFGQEYACQPISAGSLVLPHEYDACVRDALPVAEAIDPSADYGAGELFVGIDVGHTHDLTVVWVLQRGWVPREKAPGLDDAERTVYRTVAITTIARESIPTQWSMIRGMLAHPNVSRVYIDPGTVGAVLAGLATQQYGELVCPYTITRPRKMVLAERVRQFVQSRRVSLPRDDRVRADILAMRRETTDGGQVKYDGSTRFSHCDYYVALSLALAAAEEGRDAGHAMIAFDQKAVHDE